jgi:hypothetical protein
MRSFCRFLLSDRSPKRSDVRGSDESVAMTPQQPAASGSPIKVAAEIYRRRRPRPGTSQRLKRGHALRAEMQFPGEATQQLSIEPVGPFAAGLEAAMTTVPETKYVKCGDIHIACTGGPI